jgi:outer membrane protein OmpA-like peptidoglycan-associated protein
MPIRAVAVFAMAAAVMAGCSNNSSGPTFVPAPVARRSLPSVAPDPLPPLSRFVTLANGSQVATVSSDYLFDVGSDALRPEAVTALERILPQIKDHSGRISITGYTDAIGTPEFNLVLSQRRADAVRNWLASQGISTTVMTATGAGATGAPADVANAASRRVEIALK